LIVPIDRQSDFNIDPFCERYRIVFVGKFGLLPNVLAPKHNQVWRIGVAARFQLAAG